MGIKKAYIVLGLGFGDEGKGLVTDYLCKKNSNALNIRFNGGHQAGHTVFQKDGKSHIFSSIGAGTFQGTPTYWSKYCTFSPAFFVEEYKLLYDAITIYIDNQCPVTTHYDVLYNRAIETSRGDKRFGSCGVGFGATIQRHFNDLIQITVSDLKNVTIVKEKLQEVRHYYKSKFNTDTGYNFNDFNHNKEDYSFLENIDMINTLNKQQIVQYVAEDDFFLINKWDCFVFEGAQGILLDQKFGTWPYVTKSNTTSQNAQAIIQQNFKEKDIEVEMYYVTRAYLTRHGAGPFPENIQEIRLNHNQYETNIYNDYQGSFKVNYLQKDLLQYAINCDENFSKNCKKNLIITCLDQIQSDEIPIYHNYTIDKILPLQLSEYLNYSFENIGLSFSPFSEDMKLH